MVSVHISKMNKFGMVCVMLAALFVLSPVGANKIVILSGYHVPELFFLLLVCCSVVLFKPFSLEIFRIVFDSPEFHLLVILFIALGVLALMRGVSVLDIYQSIRVWLFFFLGVLFSKLIFKYKIISIDYLHLLVFFSVLFSLVYFFLYDDSSKRPFSVSLFFLATMLCFFSGRILVFYVLAVVFAYMVVVSGFRVYFIYYFMFIFFYFLAAMSGGRFFLILITMSIISCLIYFLRFELWDLFWTWVQQDESRYHQIVYKSLEFYDYLFGYGLADESATVRYEQYKMIFENISCCIFPNGMLSNSQYVFQSLYDNSSIDFGESVVSRDSILLSFLLSLGVVVMFPFAIFIILFMIHSAARWFRLGYLIFYFYTIIAICLILFGQGSVMTVTYNGFFFGVMIYIFVIGPYELETSKPFEGNGYS
ncbi:MAG: hypothetical protein ACI93R_002708 [Flavobacteriales bacterium]